jgi:hypothetical protein
VFLSELVSDLRSGQEAYQALRELLPDDLKDDLLPSLRRGYHVCKGVWVMHSRGWSTGISKVTCIWKKPVGPITPPNGVLSVERRRVVTRTMI